jgi:hypothetical protein
LCINSFGLIPDIKYIFFKFNSNCGRIFQNLKFMLLANNSCDTGQSLGLRKKKRVYIYMHVCVNFN